MVADTIEILIEADASGLTSQLKGATNTIKKFIGEINKQEVDWTSILSRTISPAIIGGIAATMAMAISSAVSFQNAMKSASANSQDAFGNAGDQMSDSILNISNATGQSATSVAAGMAKMTQLFGKDTPLAITAMDQATKLAAVTGMDLGQVVSMLIPIFDNWGVDSIPGVTDAVNDLYFASKTGKVSLSELADTVSKAGVALRDHTSFQDAVYGLEGISTQAGMTKTGTIEAFNAIAQASQTPLGSLNILTTAFTGISTNAALAKDGIVGAFANISKAIQDGGLPISLFAQKVGLSTEATAQLEKQSSATYAKTTESINQAVASQKNLNDEFQRTLTVTDMIGIAWNMVFNLLGKINIDVGKFLTSVASAGSFGALVQSLGGDLGPSSTAATTNGIAGGINAPSPGIDIGKLNQASSEKSNNSSTTNINTTNYIAKTNPLGENILGGNTGNGVYKDYQFGM